MTAKSKAVLTLLLMFFSAIVFAQKDSIQQEKIVKYRQHFWDNLPKPIGGVSDFEALYTESQVRFLDSIIRAYKLQTSIEIAIVSIDTLVVSPEKFNALTLHIANTWGVGVKGKDNGILIGISKGYRKIRIQNGYGIEKLISDDETKNIIDKYFIPSFKNEEYYNGTLGGLTSLIALLNLKLK